MLLFVGFEEYKIRKIVCDNLFFIFYANTSTRMCEINDFERWFKGPSILFEHDFDSKSW